jgi:hypothetical protein
MKRTRMCFERTDRAISIGRSPLCGGSLIICYMFFLTLMHPLEVITSFWYPNIIWVEKLLYSHFPPYLPRGDKWLYSHFSGGGNLLYSHFSSYPGKGEIWLYSHFSTGGKWLYNTGQGRTRSESIDKHEPRDILHCHVERRDQSFAVAEMVER